jgi:hypothetical protein
MTQIRAGERIGSGAGEGASGDGVRRSGETEACIGKRVVTESRWSGGSADVGRVRVPRLLMNRPDEFLGGRLLPEADIEWLSKTTREQERRDEW